MHPVMKLYILSLQSNATNICIGTTRHYMYMYIPTTLKLKKCQGLRQKRMTGINTQMKAEAYTRFQCFNFGI